MQGKPLKMMVHALISFLAITLLCMATCLAVLFGLQNYLLKHQHPAKVLRYFPPLQTMENTLFIIVWCSLLFLSATLVSGFLFQPTWFTGYLLPKAVLSCTAWALLSFLLIGRYLFGWRGPTAIRWTLSGTLLTFAAYFGTKIFLV